MISAIRSASGLFTSWRNGDGGSDAADVHDRSSHADGKHEGACHATSCCIAGTSWTRSQLMAFIKVAALELTRWLEWAGHGNPVDDDAIENGMRGWRVSRRSAPDHPALCSPFRLGNSVAQQSRCMTYRHLKRRYEPKIAKRIANHQQATKLQDVKTVTRCVHRYKLQRALFQRRS